MVKPVIVYAKVKDYLKKFVTTNSPAVGLIIGHVSKNIARFMELFVYFLFLQLPNVLSEDFGLFKITC